MKKPKWEKEFDKKFGNKSWEDEVIDKEGNKINIKYSLKTEPLKQFFSNHINSILDELEMKEKKANHKQLFEIYEKNKKKRGISYGVVDMWLVVRGYNLAVQELNKKIAKIRKEYKKP